MALALLFAFVWRLVKIFVLLAAAPSGHLVSAIYLKMVAAQYQLLYRALVLRHLSRGSIITDLKLDCPRDLPCHIK
jgi:hypothetical protein